MKTHNRYLRTGDVFLYSVDGSRIVRIALFCDKGNMFYLQESKVERSDDALRFDETIL